MRVDAYESRLESTAFNVKGLVVQLASTFFSIAQCAMERRFTGKEIVEKINVFRRRSRSGVRLEVVARDIIQIMLRNTNKRRGQSGFRLGVDARDIIQIMLSSADVSTYR